MQAERWQQIEKLFQAALERPPDERAGLLAEACTGDDELRREVESLLAEHARTGGLLALGAADLAADWLQEQERITLKQSLGHFRILAPLGRGGMGEVYLAEDSRLHRKVALKLLPTAFTQDKERVRRFEQEARAASALNHPNIITIYDIGQTEGRHFIATEYVEGQTLRALLNQGRLNLTQALDIGAQVAGALQAAHAAGIMHRDIKPENVMVRADGLVKVLDFGLARMTEQRARVMNTETLTPSEVITEAGALMGTPRYMSPEQARGQAVDCRTDIFSLGVMLYELIAGRTPFTGATASDVLAAILTSEPPPLADYLPDVPAKLEAVVTRALGKDREARYQTAEALLVDLGQLKREVEAPAAVAESQNQRPRLLTSRRWLAISTLIMLAVAGLLFLLRFRGAPAAVRPEIKSLAVLPLENYSGDPQQEYFADGMTEAMIGKLAQIRALDRVISRTSVMRYKGSSKSLPEIAAELHVDAVIEGSVQRSGGRVKITAKLIPAATDSPLWVRDYERDMNDVLRLQNEVARAIVDEIRIQITPEEQARLSSARNINPQAHDEFLLACHHLRTNEDDLRQAIEHFEQAIRLMPDYAAAYAGLSSAWAARGTFGAESRNAAQIQAREAAEQAVSLDSQLADAHIALGFVKTHDWDWAGAEAEFARALELDPNSARAHQEYADLLMALERHDEAVQAIERATQLDPLSSNIQSRYGRVLYRAQKYAQAEPHLLRAIELDPNPGNSMPYWILGELYTQMERYDEAIASFKKYQSQGGSLLGCSIGIASVYARMGKPKAARRLLDRVKATTDPANFIDIPVARAYALLGDTDEAFNLLFQQVKARNNVATYVKADPPFESLRADQRWKELLRRMNFPPE